CGEKFVVVSQKDLDPLEEFVIRQRKILVGDLIRVDMSSQYFEERMAMVRDLRYVARSTTTTDDGARVFILRNLNRGQTTNRNRNLLPQIKFGGGLEVVAFQELRIYVRSAVDVRRPIFLRIQAFSPDNGVRLWSSGQLRFQDRKRLTLVGELQWDERSERYRFRATVN
ncbi:MAG: hypothetical protein ACE5JG_01840, partial [Planctomycetota bacterium]